MCVLAEKGLVSIGVPQGSILGPLLFVLLVNDLSQSVSYSEVNMYADDTELHYSDESLPILQHKLQLDLDSSLTKWLSVNRLKINVSKSASMLIGPPQKLRDNSLSLIFADEL